MDPVVPEPPRILYPPKTGNEPHWYIFTPAVLYKDKDQELACEVRPATVVDVRSVRVPKANL